MKDRLLILEDGTYFKGVAFGGDDFKIGEIVFNTGMTGYQEILSDLSYCAQIVMMTYPLIGNYGINRDDFESIEPAVFGFVVSEYCDQPSNWRSEMNIDAFLKLKKIPGIAGIDTRMLTRKIRTLGTMKAIMADADVDIEATVKMLKETPYANNQVKSVSVQKAFPIPSRGKKVVLIDFGAKHGIIRELSKRGCDLTVVPYNASADTILSLRPDGIMLSNGPGDPKDIPEAITTIRELIGQVPIFGICLGHQLIALACGANTIKLKFGHRGSNHPVTNLKTGKTEITSQNHSFAVDETSLKGTGLVLTHRNLNDKSVEGLAHERYPLFCVQYHPEANPGPEDANYLFDDFIKMMDDFKGGKHHA